MSRHRVKAVALDDDDYYDDDSYGDEYEGGEAEAEGEGDGLSDYDKEQLRLGTIEVRKQLGPESTLTDAEIQESLWHYYYDIGKAVTYLKNKQKPAAKKPAKKSANSGGAHPTNFLPSTTIFPSISQCARLSPPTTDFFHDCPWLQVPSHRLAVITPLPPLCKGGLMGGSSNGGKTSKLAALAAKRRQKENEKLGASDKSPEASEQSAYIASLEKLRINANAPKTTKPIGVSSLRKGTRDSAESTSQPTLTAPTPPSADSVESNSSSSPAVDIPKNENTPIALVSRAQPSAFASMLTAVPTHQPSLRQLPDSLFNTSFYSNFNSSDTKAFDFTDPSPDDIVINAQKSKATKNAKASGKQASGSKGQDALAGEMKQLSVSHAPVSKSKGLDVIAEYKKTTRKPTASFVVIGHVDAGKSTLMGRLLYDLKAVDQRTIDKYKREAEKIGKGSFAFAWVLDQGSEERERGVTIDIATNQFETEKTAFTVLDAPGHQDFVPNMIAGASQADFAVLVIDASTGNFESGLKGQTKEHALLARSMGVQRIIVAINKMDSVDWSQARFEEIQQQLSAFLTTAGFQKQNISFIPCSGLEGDNILRKIPSEDASWYSGNTLVEELDRLEPMSHAMDRPLRMSIIDVFRGGVQNPLSVSGRIESGSVQVGEVVKIMPSGESAGIKGIEVDEQAGEWAVAGQNVIIHLSDIDQVHVKTGDVLCSQSSPVENITSLTAKLLAFEHLTPMHLDIHKGRLHVSGRLTQLIATLDKSTGAIIKKKPKVVQPGSLVQVKVELDQAVPLEAPARIILRSEGQTVAAGLLQ